MAIGIIIVGIVALIILIWGLMEFHRIKRRLLALLLIGLVLFTFFSLTIVFKGREVDLKTVPGVIDASKIYFSWFGNAFSNLRTITANVINMNWQANSNVTSTGVG